MCCIQLKFYFSLVLKVNLSREMLDKMFLMLSQIPLFIVDYYLLSVYV